MDARISERLIRKGGGPPSRTLMENQNTSAVNATATMVELDDFFWDDLLTRIHENEVVPIVSTPWGAGIQWRGRKFGLTAAFVQSGDDDPPSIYLGVGGGLGAEPVRTPTRPVSRP